MTGSTRAMVRATLAVVVAACSHAPPPKPIVEPRPNPAPASIVPPPSPASFDTMRPSASAVDAYRRGYMPLRSAGIDQFATAHPEWDGRGVLIAILDSGIDPGVPGLRVASDGTPKVLELRDFSGEGRVALSPVERRGDTLVVGTRRLLGASRVAGLASSPELWGGALLELPLGKLPAADLDGSGVVGDTLPVVVARGASGWILFADTQGNGTLADDRPVHDYEIAREYFGWSRPGRAPTVNIAASITDSANAPRLDLVFDTFAHGTLVSGIAAGHDIGGVAGFDGVAPGARLIGAKISNDARGGISVTGSMIRALDHVIAFARSRNMRLVVNLSFGVGNEREGTARIDALIDSVLALHPDVVMTVAAGNDGPGLSTTGFPASASRVISVGASAPPVFLAKPSMDAALETVAIFSSRGGEIASPDFVVPGEAFATVPRYAAGEEHETGTSLAAPYAAGMAARLLSAAAASGRTVSASAIRSALRAGSHHLGGAEVADEGAGLPSLLASWAALQRGASTAQLAIDVGDVRGRGGVLLTYDAQAARPPAVRVVVRRLDSNAPTLVHLRSSSPAFDVPETVALTDGRGEFTVTTRAAASLPSSGRIFVGIDNDSAVAVVPITVERAIAATAGGASSSIVVPSGGVGRVFVNAPAGRALQIEVATLDSTQRATASLHEPGGMPFRDGPLTPVGFAGAASLYDLAANDVVAGVYEVAVTGDVSQPTSVRVTARIAPVALAAANSADSVQVTARNLATTPVSLRLRVGLLGAEGIYSINGDGGPTRVTIPVPAWADRMVVDAKMPRDQWSQYTDFGMTFADRSGHILDATPIDYAFSRAQLDLPKSVLGDSLVILLDPGFAAPNGKTPWNMTLAVRYYAPKPYALDEGGAPPRPLAASATRTDAIGFRSLPIDLPGAFGPLLMLVALEGEDHIWSREVRVAGPRQ